MAIKASANITLVYVSDGTGYTVLLSNESYAFAAGTSAALAGSTSSNVVAYKNTSKVAATITKIGNSAVSGNSTGVATGITGLTADVSGNGTTTCKITFKATTALTAKNGIVTIAITVDGRAFTKDFTFSLAIKGETGQTGPQGPEGKPTGVIVSATEPSTKFDGMLWKHTGTVSGLTKDVTYRWTGTKWETYLFAATNIKAESLSALSADLGTVTAGNIKIPWSVPIGGNRRYEGNTILSKSQGGQNPLMFLWDVIETSTTSPTETVISKGNYARFDYRGMTLYDGSKVYNVDKNFVDTLEQLNRNLNAANFNLTNSTYYPVTNVIVSGRIMQLHCAGLLDKDVPADAELVIGTLPEAYRPPYKIIKYGLCSASTNRLLRLSIDVDGKVTYALTADTAKGVGVNINETFIAKV